MPKKEFDEKIRVAYQTWEPESIYSQDIYRTRILWNQYQSALSKLKRKPKLGRLVTIFEDCQLTFHTLGEGVGGYNNKHKFIVIQANNKDRANSCSRELGLPALFVGRKVKLQNHIQGIKECNEIGVMKGKLSILIAESYSRD